MISLTINGRTVAAQSGELLMGVLERIGIEVPALCHIPGLKPAGACRLCVVEIKSYPMLMPACSTPVAEGMVIMTHSPRVMQARRTIIELILQRHPNDCLLCVRNETCKLRILAEKYGVHPNGPRMKSTAYGFDATGDAISFDPKKCILCGNCTRICNEQLKISAVDFTGRGQNTAVTCEFHRKISESSCIECGICLKSCPTAAIAEADFLPHTISALASSDYFPVVQYSALTTLALADFFKIRSNVDLTGRLNAAFRQIGFKAVFNTEIADLVTVEEQASEIMLRRMRKNTGPLLPSASPVFIKFILKFFPDFAPLISRARSGQGITGTLIRHYFAKRFNLDPAKIFSVAVTPCIGKKIEARIPIFEKGSHPDVNAVLTVRELIRLINLHGVDIRHASPEPFDELIGKYNSARSLSMLPPGAYSLLLAQACCRLATGENLRNPKFRVVRESKGIREIQFRQGPFKFNSVIIDGLDSLRVFLNDCRRNKRSDLDAVDILCCKGGCINGPGMPDSVNPEKLYGRIKALCPDVTVCFADGKIDPDIGHFYRTVIKGGPGSENAAKLFYVAEWNDR